MVVGIKSTQIYGELYNTAVSTFAKLQIYKLNDSVFALYYMMSIDCVMQ